MEFISNNSNKHSTRINELIKSSESIFMSVAFVKQSGTSLLISALKKAVADKAEVKIIAGQHFSHTEPEALFNLRKTLPKQPPASLYIAQALPKSPVFHPKLYLFRKGNKGTIICGSANITKGGLENNIECSICISCNINDPIWKQAYEFFQQMLLPEFAEEATLMAIRRYQNFYENQRAAKEKVRTIPNRNENQLEFNYANLLIHLKQFNKAERDKIFKEKEYHYKEAKKVLDKIANDSGLTKAKFIFLLEELISKKGQKGWWHSGSLHRHKQKVFTKYKEFQQLVQYIKKNAKGNPSKVFSEAKDIVNKIEGAGVNYVTEIMMTYNSTGFANLNNNPITVLRKEGDIYIKASTNSFSGNDYEAYCELVLEINNKLGLINMLEADSFFNDIYWRIYKKNKQ